MSNADIRKAHRIVTNAGSVMTREQIDLLRSMLPPLPKQKTLEEIHEEIQDAWMKADGNEWPDDAFGEIESWLEELVMQIKELIYDKPLCPEFLETEADYENAPEGTVVACQGSPPWHKFDSAWLSTITHGRNNDKRMSGIIRRVLRWGCEND